MDDFGVKRRERILARIIPMKRGKKKQKKKKREENDSAGKKEKREKETTTTVLFFKSPCQQQQFIKLSRARVGEKTSKKTKKE